MQLNRIPTGYSALWSNGIIFFARHLRDTHDTIYAQVEVKVRDTDQFLLWDGHFNLSSATVRKSHAKMLEEKRNLGDSGNWQDMLDEASQGIVMAYSQGNPLQFAGTGEDLKPPEWALEPFIRKGMMNGILGKRDSGKSMLAIAFATVSQMALYKNPLGIALTAKPLLFLYLDWETSFEDFDWRYKCVCAGLEIEPQVMPYRKCEKPLSREFEGVAQTLEESKADGIIIDSVGMAAGGDLNKTESPFEFLAALRALSRHDNQPLTSLIIGHPSKDESNKTTFSGSGFFSNEVRNTWELIARPSVNQGEKILELYHNKWNTTFYHKPRTLLMTWDEPLGMVTFKQGDSPDDPQDKKVPLWMRAKNVLARGAMDIGELRAELGLTASSKEAESLGTTLSRKRELFINLDGKWGLKARES